MNVLAPSTDFQVGRITKDKRRLDAGYRMGLEEGLHYLRT